MISAPESPGARTDASIDLCNSGLLRPAASRPSMPVHVRLALSTLIATCGWGPLRTRAIWISLGNTSPKQLSRRGFPKVERNQTLSGGNHA